MLAIIAALLFALSFFGVHPDGHSLTDLGLVFLALHVVWPYHPWRQTAA